MTMGAALAGATPAGAGSTGAAAAGAAAAVAAVDLGASGGRVMIGQVGRGQLDLHEAHRFPNTPVRVLGTLHWDILALYRNALEGLRAAGPLRRRPSQLSLLITRGAGAPRVHAAHCLVPL